MKKRQNIETKSTFTPTTFYISLFLGTVFSNNPIFKKLKNKLYHVFCLDSSTGFIQFRYLSKKKKKGFINWICLREAD